MSKFRIFLIILIIAVGSAGIWYFQKNIFSKETLKLEIIGPNEAELGKVIEYLVKYKNNGNFRLDEPELIFEAPENSVMEGDKPLRQSLGAKELGEAIYPGEERSFSFKMRLLGEEGGAKIAKAWISYRPKNLKAKFESSTTFTTVINSVPITFDFDFPSRTEPGKNLIIRINYFSNVDYPLSNLKSIVEYPPGFEFVESNPKPLEQNEWEIGLLNKSEGGRIEITGKLSGEVGDKKIFRARFGIWQDGEFVLLKEVVKGIEINKPSLYIRQEINGNPEYIASLGDWLHYVIFFKNIGEESLNNLFLVNKLEGDIFDFQTIKSDSGNYNEGDNSIVFDWRQVQKLQFLNPTEEGKIEFWIKLKDDFELTTTPVIRNKVFLGQAKEEFVTKVNSKLEITQKGFFQDEIFGNSGPIPPKVGLKTTYTIIWQAKNYFNDVKDVKVRTTLPQGVELTGKIFPESETSKFSYDPQSREIVWSIGDMEKGKGVSSPAPNISFQIAFTPQESQKGKTPDIIGETKITGENTWTNQTIQSSGPAINTTLPDDQTITDEMGIVQ